MNININCAVSGKITSLLVRDKNGNLKTSFENIPNLITQGMTAYAALGTGLGTVYAMPSNSESFEDLNGTWNQSANVITRATGTGTFPSSPDQIGNELYWYNAGSNTGHRCHVVSRASDTSIVVSGSALTITGGSLRRYLVNSTAMSTNGFKQGSSTITSISDVFNDIAGTWVRNWRVNFVSPGTAYTLGSIIFGNTSRVKLPTTVDIGADDQLQIEYAITETCTGRSQVYDLGAESVGIPQKYTLASIVGNGTYVDVTFSASTHFLAGDKLDLRGVATKRAAISSASSTSTTFTVNTTPTHGLSVGNSVTIENASLAGYNGVFTVATVPNANTFTITNSANPGAMGTVGTARLTTPGSYYDSLGLATIASMQSASVARVTSAVTGPAVDSVQIGGDPGVTVKAVRQTTGGTWILPRDSTLVYAIGEANVMAILDETTPVVYPGPSVTQLFAFDSVVSTDASPATDWTNTVQFTKNAGTGTSATRIKQIYFKNVNGYTWYQVTFNTPFNKTITQRLRVTLAKQIKRDIQIPA